MYKPTHTQDALMLVSVASEIWQQHEGSDEIFPLTIIDHYGRFAVEIRRATGEEEACSDPGAVMADFTELPEDLQAEIRRWVSAA